MKNFRLCMASITMIAAFIGSLLLILHGINVYGKPLTWQLPAHIAAVAFLWLTLAATGHHIEES